MDDLVCEKRGAHPGSFNVVCRVPCALALRTAFSGKLA
jgi:hypothetical protein